MSAILTRKAKKMKRVGKYGKRFVVGEVISQPFTDKVHLKRRAVLEVVKSSLVAHSRRRS